MWVRRLLEMNRGRTNPVWRLPAHPSPQPRGPGHPRSAVAGNGLIARPPTHGTVVYARAHARVGAASMRGQSVGTDPSVFINVFFSLIRVAEPIVARIEAAGSAGAPALHAALEELFPERVYGLTPEAVDEADRTGTSGTLVYYGSNRLGGTMSHLRKERGFASVPCVAVCAARGAHADMRMAYARRGPDESGSRLHGAMCRRHDITTESLAYTPYPSEIDDILGAHRRPAGRAGGRLGAWRSMGAARCDRTANNA